ncbi:MAG: DUF3267 domain-containing protein [Nitrososphaerales archaeon]
MLAKVASYSPSRRVMLALNLFGLSLALGVLLATYDVWSSYSRPLVLVGLAALALVVTVVIHEGLHGLTFRIFTGKAVFGAVLGSPIGFAFYTTSDAPLPSRLLTSKAYIVTALLPQALTLVAVAVAYTAPSPFDFLGACIASYNLGGSAADIWTSGLVASLHSGCFLEDTRDGLNIWMEA